MAHRLNYARFYNASYELTELLPRKNKADSDDENNAELGR